MMKASNNQLKKAYCLNIITFALILFSTVWMFTGLHFGNLPTPLEANRFKMFKYYTVDSNIIMGIIALCAALIQKDMLNGKRESFPLWGKILKLIGVVGVTLTMLVTAFFLVPTLGFITCYNNSNVFLHLVNPVLSIVTYICYEATDEVTFKHTFTGISSMLLYAVFYVVNAVVHSHNNVVDKGYDWYGFLVLGVKSAVYVIPLLVLITYLISLGLWFANRRAFKRFNK